MDEFENLRDNPSSEPGTPVATSQHSTNGKSATVQEAESSAVARRGGASRNRARPSSDTLEDPNGSVPSFQPTGDPHNDYLIQDSIVESRKLMYYAYVGQDVLELEKARLESDNILRKMRQEEVSKAKELEATVRKNEAQLQEQVEEIEELRRANKEKLNEKVEEIEKLRGTIQERDAALAEKQKGDIDHKGNAQQMRAELKIKDTQLEDQRERLQKTSKDVKELRLTLSSKEAELVEKQEEDIQHKVLVQTMTADMNIKDARIEEQYRRLQEKAEDVEELRLALQRKEVQLVEKQEEDIQHKLRVHTMSADLKIMEARAEDQRVQLAKQDRSIQRLERLLFEETERVREKTNSLADLNQTLDRHQIQFDEFRTAKAAEEQKLKDEETRWVFGKRGAFTAAATAVPLFAKYTGVI